MSCNDPKTHRARVLVADDSAVVRDITRTLLERAGFDVEVVEDGREAYEAVRSGRAFDVVLMDLDMPRMDGIAATRAIRGRGLIPILAVSADRRPEVADRAVKASMDARLLKTFDARRLAIDVQACLADTREAAAREKTAPAGDLLNRDVLDGFCGRFKPERVSAILALFRHQIDRAIDICREGRNLQAIAFEAHGLIASAGMLGFEALRASSDHVQSALGASPPGAASPQDAIAGLLLTLEQTATALHHLEQARRSGDSGVLLRPPEPGGRWVDEGFDAERTRPRGPSEVRTGTV